MPINPPRTSAICLCAIAVLSADAPALGDVIEYDEWDERQSAIGEFTTIEFSGFSEWTIITDQFAYLGVHFTDGNDVIEEGYGYLNDGWDLWGHAQIHLLFDIPMSYIAADFPGLIQFDLFSEGELMYTSTPMGVGGVGCFGGLLSTDPFDAVIAFDPTGVASPSTIFTSARRYPRHRH